MQIIDNINKTVKDDLQAGIHKGSKMSVAAACFSIYAYQELKKQLDSIDELRFIFTSPTFVTEKASKAQREFYIPRISRECSLYGTEFEVKLRNELTQKAIAKECADWIRRKVVFKSNVTQEQMMGFMTVDESTYMPINGFTTVDLGCERGNNAYYPVQKTESFENANYFLRLFEQLWNDKKKLQEVTDVVIENISVAYRENAPEYIYFVALYSDIITRTGQLLSMKAQSSTSILLLKRKAPCPLCSSGSLRNPKSIAQESILRRSATERWFMMWWIAINLCWKR